MKPLMLAYGPLIWFVSLVSKIRAVQFSLLSSDLNDSGEIERGAVAGVLDVVFA